MPQFIGVLLVIYIVCLIIYYIIIPGILIIASIGAFFGLIVSLYNYGLAFKKNVKLEKPTL